MKKNNWILYLFETDEKKDIVKIMEFKTMRDVSFVLNMDASVISNWYHGLINANTITPSQIFCVGIAATTSASTSPFSTSLGSGAVSIDAYKIGLFDGTTNRYSVKEILDFTSYENTYITSNFFFNNLNIGTSYRMALYGRCVNSGSLYINSGGRGTTGSASRSFHQPAFMKFYEYDSSIGGARTT